MRTSYRSPCRSHLVPANPLTRGVFFLFLLSILAIPTLYALPVLAQDSAADQAKAAAAKAAKAATDKTKAATTKAIDAAKAKADAAKADAAKAAAAKAKAVARPVPRKPALRAKAPKPARTVPPRPVARQPARRAPARRAPAVRAVVANQLKVTHQPPKAILPGVSVVLSFGIDENEELEEVYLRYRRKGDTTYRKASSKLTSGTIYNVKLKAFQVREPALEYYLEALNASSQLQLLLGSPTNPLSVKVDNQATTAGNKGKAAKLRRKEVLDSLARSETVVSTSRTEQRLQTAPGIVSVITGAEIRAAGWRRLPQILRYMVGVEVNDNHFGGEIGGRGIVNTFTYSDKVVILIDGHNYAVRNTNRIYLSSALVSVDNIARIEIVRGPGSALWGSSALLGVINIITKTAQGFEGLEGTFGGSPRSRSYFLNLQGGQKILGAVSFSASFSLQQNNHQFLRAPVYEFKQLTGLSFYPRSEEYGQNATVSLSYKGFTLRLRQMRYSPTATLYTTSQSINSQHIHDRLAAKLTYSTLLSSWGALSAWAGVDYFYYAPGSIQIQNAHSRYFSNPRLAGSGTSVNVFPKDGSAAKTYPMCSELAAGAPGPCVRLKTKGNQRFCSLVDGPQEGATEIQELPYAVGNVGECRNAWLGQTTLTEGAQEVRVEAGVQLQATFFGKLHLNLGLEVEAAIFDSNYIVEYNPLSPTTGERRIVSDTIFHGSAFLQAQYRFNRVFQLTAGVRVDADSNYPETIPVVATPRAALVISPGAGFYIKALYGNAFKAPSHFTRFSFRGRDALLFGNPTLTPEQVHSADLQVSWFWKRKLMLALGGYFAYYDNLINLSVRGAAQPLVGEKQWIDYFERQFGNPNTVATQAAGKATLPSGARPYVQAINRGEAYTYGGEFSMQLTPIRGLNIRANFGIHLGQRSVPDPNDPTKTVFTPVLLEAAVFKGALVAAYQFPMGPVYGSIVLGAQISGSKRRLAQGSQMVYEAMTGENTRDTNGNPIGAPVSFPTWKPGESPTDDSPLSVHTFATFQVLRILGTMDAGIRVSNLLNRENYDSAGLIMLGQPMIDVNLWLRVHL